MATAHASAAGSTRAAPSSLDRVRQRRALKESGASDAQLEAFDRQEYGDPIDSGPATASDRRQMASRARAGEKPNRDAYQAGLQEGRATKKPSSSGGLNFDAGEEAGALLLGLIAYALLANYVRGGWGGVTSWLSAKFLNKGGSTTTVHHTPSSDPQLAPAPGAGPTGTTPGSGGQSPTSPPSSEGYGSRVPTPGAQLNQPPPAPPGWQNPFGQPGGASDPNLGRWS